MENTKEIQNIKPYHFLRTHMAAHFGSILIIMLQIVVTVVVFNLFWGDFQRLLIGNGIYQALDLDNVACLTIKDKDDAIFSQIEQPRGVALVCENDNSFLFTSNRSESSITVQPMSPACIERFGSRLAKGYWQENNNPQGTLNAVISKNLAKRYRLGKTYTIYNAADDIELTVYITGVTKDNEAFVPPAYGAANSIISDIRNTLFLCCDGQTAQEIFGDALHSGIYTVAAEDRTALENFAAGIDIQQYAYADVRSAKEADDYFLRSEMGTPLAITVIMLILCLANFSSYAMLSAIGREKEFAVYFISGATWRDCLRLQLAEDILIITLPFAAAVMVCGILSVNRVSAVMTAQGMLLSVALCATVMLISSLAALLRIQKKSPVEIIRS